MCSVSRIHNIHRLVSVMGNRCAPAVCEVGIEYLFTGTLFYQTSGIAVHSDPFA